MKRLFFLFSFLITLQVKGQDFPSVTIKADSARFSQLVESIEDQTDFRVFYKAEWVDTLSFNLDLQQQPLNRVLDAMIEETLLSYYVQDKSIYFLYNTKVVSEPKIAEFLTRKSDDIQSDTEKGLIFSRDYQTPELEGAEIVHRVVEIGSKQKMVAGGNATIAGYVKKDNTGEPLPGVVVYTESARISATTDHEGFYSLSLPVGKHNLIFKLLGLKPAQKNIVLFSNGQLNITMEDDIVSLREVVIRSNRGANVDNLQMGLSSLNMAEIKNVPVVLGERDVMKVATTLAGIKTVGEGAAGFNVRGGKADQNLITLDGAPIYNTSHFLGFFSVFNSEAIEDMQIYKGSIPARYGGRLSSVMDISSLQANRDSISGTGGISPVTSKLTLEIPLFKGKAGLMIGGRTTYSNWILKKIRNPQFSQNRIAFSDVILRHDYDINSKNKLTLSAYYSLDNFRMASDTLFSASDFRYENRAGSITFLHQFSKNLSSNLSVFYSDYRYNLSNSASPVNSFNQNFQINEGTVKGELNYSLNNRHEFSAGVEVKQITTNPGAKWPFGEESLVAVRETQKEQALESAAFISGQYKLTNSLSIDLGLRYSLFTSFGPQMVNIYLPDGPRNSDTKTDSVWYKKGDKIITYSGLEPRFSTRLKLSELSSIKGGYMRTRQYVHTLTNSASLSPTDIWRLSSTYLKPQVADQFSIGYFRDFKVDDIETSLEFYYRDIHNLLDFKVGSDFLLNPQVETATLQGPGKAYGFEFSLKKSGRLNGWLNYTFARTFIKLDSEHGEERINGGAYYPANYDMPHAVNLVANYKLTHRLSFSYNFAYRSGRPITYPMGVYDFHESISVHYSDRNSFRIPDYMRMDIGVNLEAGHKLGKLTYSYWNFSVYNVLGRDNPYSIFFNVERGRIRGYQLIVFGIPIPTISYNFRF